MAAKLKTYDNSHYVYNGTTFKLDPYSYDRLNEIFLRNEHGRVKFGPGVDNSTLTVKASPVEIGIYLLDIARGSVKTRACWK